MPSKRNISDLSQLQDNLSRAKTVVLTDYKGLSVAKITQLRHKLAQVQAELKVSKNTLLNLAFKAGHYEIPQADKELTGPSAIVFAFGDEVAPVKVLYDFYKENNLPVFKIGFLGKEYLPKNRVEQLGQLPAREVLLAQVLGGLNAPLSGLVGVLQGNLTKLVCVLKEIGKGKN